MDKEVAYLDSFDTKEMAPKSENGNNSNKTEENQVGEIQEGDLEEIDALNNELDILKSALDVIEKQADDVIVKLIELLNSNKEIRQSILNERAQEMEQNNSVDK